MRFRLRNRLVTAPKFIPIVYCFTPKSSTTSPINPPSQVTEINGVAKNFKKGSREDPQPRNERQIDCCSMGPSPPAPGPWTVARLPAVAICSMGPSAGEQLQAKRNRRWHSRPRRNLLHQRMEPSHGLGAHATGPLLRVHVTYRHQFP